MFKQVDVESRFWGEGHLKSLALTNVPSRAMTSVGNLDLHHAMFTQTIVFFTDDE